MKPGFEIVQFVFVVLLQFLALLGRADVALGMIVSCVPASLGNVVARQSAHIVCHVGKQRACRGRLGLRHVLLLWRNPVVPSEVEQKTVAGVVWTKDWLVTEKTFLEAVTTSSYQHETGRRPECRAASSDEVEHEGQGK